MSSVSWLDLRISDAGFADGCNGLIPYAVQLGGFMAFILTVGDTLKVCLRRSGDFMRFSSRFPLCLHSPKSINLLSSLLASDILGL